MGKTDMYLRLIRGAVLKRRSRILISLLAVALGAAVVSAMVSVYYDMEVKMHRELRTYGANVAVAPASGQQYIGQAELERLTASVPKNKLIGFNSYLYGVVTVDGQRLVAAGTHFDQATKVSPYWKVEGAWPSAGKVLVGKAAAEKLQVKVGDKLLLAAEKSTGRMALEISGILSTGAIEDNQLFMDMEMAEGLFGLPGQVNIAYGSILADAQWVEKWAVNNSDSKTYDARPIRKISQAEGNILERISALVYLLVIVILVSTLLCLASTAMAMVLERRQEIALKKALGADNVSIMKEFFGESIILGVVGGFLGWLLGLALAQAIGYSVFSSGVTVRWQVMPVVLGTAVLLSCSASLLPIRKAIAVQPAVVLKGD
ncbi:ABC transporter permease [Metallumcola ferriviriculae]|uniref:ABC transporter permease n=1 Tax=Metallumcola ferriviriculae TaxID=3039180 RepID=A0AAU0ULW9_9FIRM|nr:ABC transporter permease [Desulfitibacteraceae bacterium MK1]